MKRFNYGFPWLSVSLFFISCDMLIVSLYRKERVYWLNKSDYNLHDSESCSQKSVQNIIRCFPWRCVSIPLLLNISSIFSSYLLNTLTVWSDLGETIAQGFFFLLNNWSVFGVTGSIPTPPHHVLVVVNCFIPSCFSHCCEKRQSGSSQIRVHLNTGCTRTWSLTCHENWLYAFFVQSSLKWFLKDVCLEINTWKFNCKNVALTCFQKDFQQTSIRHYSTIKAWELIT